MQRSSARILRAIATALAFAIMASGMLAIPAYPGTTSGQESHSAAVISFSALPSEAQRTARLIRNGGPFPYERDGVVFGNFERLLPKRERGYYREYTVTTPGVKHRGARRLVVGRGGELYYTSDHYASFSRVQE